MIKRFFTLAFCAFFLIAASAEAGAIPKWQTNAAPGRRSSPARAPATNSLRMRKGGRSIAERRRFEAAERARQLALAITRRRAADQALKDETAANIAKDETTGEDLAVRRATLDALGDKAGTVVVMSPKTGQVYTVINQDWGLRRAVKPCATVKLVTGLAGLTERVINPARTDNIADTNFPLDLTDSLAFSHNGYFQRVGGEVGFDKMIEYARKLGLGELTGINHAAESPGRLPVFKEGDAVNHMSSHGDDIEVTAIQLARMASAIGNGGTLLVPHLPRTPEEEANFKREVKRDIDIPQESLRRMLPGMVAAVNYGTARAAQVPLTLVAGKTGTCTEGGTGSNWLGLFTSFAPVYDPQLAVAVILRGSDARGKVAAQVAGEVYRRLSMMGRMVSEPGAAELASINQLFGLRPRISGVQAAKFSDEDLEVESLESATAAEQRSSSLVPEPSGEVKELMFKPGHLIKTGSLSTPRGENEDVSRYPSVECQDEVRDDQEFTVLVSLTEEQVTPGVEVTKGADPLDNDKVNLALPRRADIPERNAWRVNAVILAPDFQVLDNSDKAELVLPRQGDSDVAAFRLKAKPINGDVQVSKVYVTFWHAGAFLARVSRTVKVRRGTPAEGEAPPLTNEEPAAKPATAVRSPGSVLNQGVERVRESLEQLARGEAVTPKTDAPLNLGSVAPAPEPVARASSAHGVIPAEPPVKIGPAAKPDLTIYVTTKLSRRGEAQIVIDSPYLQVNSATIPVSAGTSDWLAVEYRAFVGMRPRDATPESGAVVDARTSRERLRGFGRELYKRLAPPAFKDAFWKLVKARGDRFKTIQIYTDDPTIPWELMRPMSEDGKVELEFLGLEFSVGRWHVNGEGPVLPRPPGLMRLREFITVAPEYKGAQALPAQLAELRALSAFPRYRRIRGSLAALRLLFANPPDGIIHFAGHGAADARPNITDFRINLEDGSLDPTTLRGMIDPRGRTHPLIFFNACEVGRAEHVANFVNGWAPVVLESGASGYIGALWPLGDRGAAEFATNFYKALGGASADGRIAVADVLTATRREYLKNGDPTFLAYVYYGDPNLRLEVPQTAKARRRPRRAR